MQSPLLFPTLGVGLLDFKLNSSPRPWGPAHTLRALWPQTWRKSKATRTNKRMQFLERSAKKKRQRIFSPNELSQPVQGSGVSEARTMETR